MLGKDLVLEKESVLKSSKKGCILINKGNLWISTPSGEDIILKAGDSFKWDKKGYIYQSLDERCEITLFY